MKLENYRKLIRAYVPSAKISVINNTLLDLLINLGVEDVNARAAVYQGDKKFDVTAETQTYLIHDEIDDYVGMDESGLWWNEGSASSPKWKKLDPMTRRALDDQYPMWKDDDSDDPLRYVTEGDNLLVHPKTNVALTDGFWAYYIKKPTAMTDGSHYPFTGSPTEITAFTVLDDAIIDFVRWKLSRPLVKSQNQQGLLTESDYQKSLAAGAVLVKRRFDISANPDARMRAPSIGC